MTITGLGVSQELLDQVFAASEAFFAQPTTQKRKLGYGSAEDNFGYQGIGEESLEPGACPDLKEAITLRDVLSRRSLAWGDPDFQRLVETFYEQCLQAAHRLQRVLALALGQKDDFFVSCHKGENVTLRMLHYPPLQPGNSSQMGAGAHTDYGMLTLLFQDDQGGLEVQAEDGGWLPVPPRSGSVVINAGDLLQRWTNDVYRSTRHRVRPRDTGRDRYSIAFFVDPDADTEVSCLDSCTDAGRPRRYPPILAGEHILAKLKATHID